MATSTRRTIENAVITALEAITDMKLVTQDQTIWSGRDLKDYPNVFVDFEVTDSEWFTHPQTTADDRQSTLLLTIQGETFDLVNGDIETSLDEIEQEVEKAITENANIEALVIDCELNSRERDRGTQERYGIFQQVYSITYHYNHNSP